MRFAFVGTRNGKPVVNWSFTLIVGFLTAVGAVGLSFLIGGILPESAITDTLCNLLPLTLPIIIFIPLLVRGLTTPPDQLPKLD